MAKFAEDVHLPRGAAVLVAPCGSGELIAALAGRRLGLRLFGADAYPANLQRARERLAGLGLEASFARSSPDAVPFADGSFDAVLAPGALVCAPDPEHLLVGLSRLLRGSAVLALSLRAACVGDDTLVAAPLRPAIPIDDLAVWCERLGLRVDATAEDRLGSQVWALVIR